MFISGTADTLVPPRMMSELHRACNSVRKQLLLVPDGTHNETWTVQGYYHSVAVFLQNCRIQGRQEKDFSNKIDIGKFEAIGNFNKIQNV